MGWWCCFRKRRAYSRVFKDEEEAEPINPEPAQFISASLDSEYDLEQFRLASTVSALYKKVSEWSLPKKQKMNLFTVTEEEHDFLIDSPILPEDRQQQQQQPTPDDIFDDVVDEMV